MLITNEENRERNHPLFTGQAVWSSVTLEIDSCPYFLVSSDIQEDGIWYRQTSIVYDLRNLMTISRRILANENERIAQVALITPTDGDQDKTWGMHNLREIWIDKTGNRSSKEIYVTEDLQEFYYSHYAPISNSFGKIKIFSFDDHK